MRTSRHLQLYSILFLLLSTLTSAWPWPRWLPELDALIVRQNDNNSTSPAQSGTKSTATGSSNLHSITAAPTQTNKGSSSGSSSSNATDNSGSRNGSTTSSQPSQTLFDPELPAGGVEMITPAVTSGAQYYRIGEFVTFAWNYTSLLATPTAVNILATCTANNQLYTISMNQTVTNSTGAVTWDTGAYQATALGDPLLTETYTLIIYDAASSISAQPEAGFLAAYDQYTFGMYTSQPYTPLNDFQCVTCSGALSDMERRALGMVIGMGIITVMSFTWFVSGLGVIW